MHTFKYIPNPAPYGHGVYALVHSTTQSVYIGSSTNLRARAFEWASTMRRNPHKIKHFPSTRPEDYEFRVLLRTEGKTANELREIELTYIERVRVSGFTLLNRVAPAIRMEYTLDGLTGSATFHASRMGKHPQNVLDRIRRGATIEQALAEVPYHKPYDARAQIIDAMPVSIVLDGEPATYAELGAYWGITSDAAKKRVKRARAQHPDRTEFDADLDF